jgi:signal transduction histidine kinase
MAFFVLCGEEREIMDWGYILCVDENLHELNTLANQIQEEFSRSHIVYKAESVEEATLVMDMLQATQKRIELIICGQKMPGIQGSAFLESVHQATPEIMAILLFDPGDRLSSEYLLARATVQNIIEKPWRKEHLILTVESLLKLYKISQNIEALQEIGLQFGPIFGLPELLRKTIQYIEDITTASKVAIAITDGKTLDIQLPVSNTSDEIFDERAIKASEQLIHQIFAKRREPLVFNHVSENQYLQQFDLPEWYKADHLVCIPLWRKETFFGVIFMADKQSGLPFFREDVLLVKIIVYQLLASLENMRLTEEKLRMERLSTIGNMAGEIIHDLKGPMTTIMGFAELLERNDCTPQEQKIFSTIISTEVEQMVEMAEEILEFSRGGKMKLTLQPCNVEQLVAEVAEVLKRSFSEQGIQLVTKLTCKRKIYADKEKLKRVFYNIANNAKEAMRDQGRFSINTYFHHNTHVEFRLADNGPGIPPYVKENIFEPFVTYGKKRGTGLGMSIVKKIVTDHGGDIWVESEEGKGTIFYFTIPIAQKMT